MPPPRRRPAIPPARRPKVAGRTRRPETQEDAAPETPAAETAPETASEITGVIHPTEIRTEIRSEIPTEIPAEIRTEAPEESHRRVRTARRRDPVPVPAPPEPLDAEEIDLPEASAQREELPVSEPEAVAETEDLPESEPEDEPAEREPNYLIPIILVVAALVIAGLGYWFTVKRNDAMAGADNGALVDVGGTQQLVDAAKQGVVNALSYKFDELDKAGTRAKEYLDGEAVGQYDKTMQAIKPDIEKQKLQVVVNPVNVAVVNLAGDEARVLVFADQIGVRADKQPAGGPTQFAMDMRRVDGKWKISRLDFFDGK